MSCEKNGRKFGATASVKNGISQAAGKAGNAAGATISALARAEDAYANQVQRRMAPASNAVLKAVDRPAVVAAGWAPMAAMAVAGTMTLARFQVRAAGAGLKVGADGSITPPAAVAGIGVTLRDPRDPVAQKARGAYQGVSKANKTVSQVAAYSTFAGSVATAVVARKGDKAGQRTLQLKEGDEVVNEVSFSKSKKLTGFLNRASLMGSHRLGKGVISSEGDVVRGGGSGAWHRGTSTVKTPAGTRTITNLQSLNLPARQYYFDRKLSDQEVAGIVSGREKAHRMAGYVGEISPTENLAPSWAATKKAMIVTRLYHPTKKPAKPEWKMVKKE